MESFFLHLLLTATIHQHISRYQAHKHQIIVLIFFKVLLIS